MSIAATLSILSSLTHSMAVVCQGNTIISVTRPPTKIKQERKRREREREKRERLGSMVLRDYTNDSGNPKRLKLGLQLPTGTVFILYRYSRMFLDE